MADSTACNVYSGVVPHVWWPSDVRALKAQLSTDLQTTNIAAHTCAGLDAALLAQWGLFYENAIGWTASETGLWGLGAQADRGQAYQCQLYAWQLRLAAVNCKLVIRNPDPNNESGPDAGKTPDAIKWVGIAVASVAGAYVVGQALSVILVALPRRKG